MHITKSEISGKFIMCMNEADFATICLALSYLPDADMTKINGYDEDTASRIKSYAFALAESLQEQYENLE